MTQRYIARNLKSMDPKKYEENGEPSWDHPSDYWKVLEIAKFALEDNSYNSEFRVKMKKFKYAFNISVIYTIYLLGLIVWTYFYFDGFDKP